ncbi:MAG: TonB-dependent receptor [Gemmatimonadetes bacterium]|nr:TonB-dependent receptor [Gemmatimonadota bacterium]
MPRPARARPTLLILVVALALAPVARAQAPEPAGAIVAGRVHDAVTEEPIVGAMVRVRGSDVPPVATDARGRFALRGIAPGIVTLDVRRVGYVPVERADVAASAGKPVELAIAMTRAIVQLAELTIRPQAYPALPPPTTPVSTTSLSFEEVRRTPGAQEDVVQALAILPGIATTTGGRNDLFVRGGAAYENLFVVDNLEVPNINHFGTQGGTGGPLSLVNVRFIESAALSAGGFGARYGDRLSSATVLTLREGNRERTAGELNVAASQFGALVEGPAGPDASYFVNVRRSYLDLLFKALGQSFIPTYTDATVKATWRPGAHDVLSLLAIGAIDEVTFNSGTADGRLKNARILAPSQDQYMAGLTWKRLLGAGVVTTTLGRTWSRYRTQQFDTLAPPNAVFTLRSTEGEWSLRSDLSWQVAPTLTLDAGVQLRRADELRYDILLPGASRTDAAGAPQPLRVDTTWSASRGAAYVQGSWQATDALRLVAGLRADRYDILAQAVRVAPRLSASYTLDERTTLSASLGRYYQAPSFIWLMGDSGNARRLEPLRADQLVLGLQRLVGDDWRVQVEGYVKRYAAYPARTFRPNAVLQPAGFGDVTTDIPFGLEPLTSAGTGRVVGAEALVQKKLGATPWYALASVTVSASEFTSLVGPATRGAFDTPLIVNLVGGWRPSARWELSGRVRTSVGLPVTPFFTSGAQAGTLDFSRVNGDRLPAFFALDLRTDRRWTLGHTQLIAFVDVANANLTANTTAYQWNPRTRLVEASRGLKVLPTIGINWEF